MSSIIRITNKETGAIYAYESTSYRDPITKKPKTKRKYLGRVDPETGDIIPKADDGKRNRSPIGKQNDISDDHTQQVIKSLNERIINLEQSLSANTAASDALLKAITKAIAKYEETISTAKK